MLLKKKLNENFVKKFYMDDNINNYIKKDYSIRPAWDALRVTVIYGSIGVFFILISGKILVKIADTIENYEELDVYEGIIYVLLTMLVVWILVYRKNVLFKKAINKIYKNCEDLNQVNEELTTLEEELRQQFNEADRQKDALILSNQRYKLAVEGVEGGIWEWDLQKDGYYFSEKWINYLGYEKNELGNNFNDWKKLLHPDEIKEVAERVENYIQSKQGIYESNYRMKCKDGNYIFVLSKGRALWDENGKAIRMAGSHTDITKQKETENKLSFLAHNDVLTNLPNRLYFEKKVNELIEGKKSSNSKFALVYMDIDDFKHINDTLGHSTGNILLKYISNILKYQVKQPDIVARLGGDEFALIFENIKDEKEVADKIQNLMKFLRRPWTLNNQKFFISYSIGISIYPQNGEDLSLLLKNADIAMYYVKKNAKDDYCFYADEMEEKNSTHIKMINDLRVAISKEQFVLFYQPIIDLQNQKIVGVEALVRWIHPVKGMVSPMEFIPLAEETGLIYDIDKWVLSEALSQKKKWEEEGYPHIKMSINISGKMVTNISFVNKFKELVADANLVCEEIQLEVTETAVMEDIDASTQVLKEIKALGIKIALDDFGKGYSSLTYLQKLPIDIVKLDREFIISILEMGQNDVLVETIIKLTHDLNLKIVAEGIETKEQLEFLKLCKSDYGQGYLFSKPVKNEDLEKLLKLNFESTMGNEYIGG